MKQILQKGKMKAKQGSVLFTVVTVMMVMVVFLMSTLILTSSANRRSYYTFFETQAQYAAQAALDAVTTAAYQDAEFFEFAKNGGGDVTLNFNGSGMHLTNGRPVTCKVEPIDDTYIWDNDTQMIRKQEAWKITVTASVGNGRNAAEYTTCNYIYSNYRNPMVNPDFENSAQWDYVSEILVEQTYGGGTAPGEPASKAKAVYTFSDMASGNNMICLGPQTAGVSRVPAGRVNYDQSDIPQNEQAFTNQSVGIGKALFVGNSATNDSLVFVAQAGCEGAAVYGNLTMQNEAAFYSNIGSVPAYYENSAYLYIDGTLRTSNYLNLGVDPTGRTAEPFNLYAGAMQLEGKLDVYGDIYLFDPALDSNTSSSSETNLAMFAYNNIQKANFSSKGYTGGDIFCNNNSLTLDKKGVYIGGDLIFTNPNGTLTISDTADIYVEGAIVCAGNLVITNNGHSVTANGGIYADPEKTVISGGTVNGTNNLEDACNSSAGFTTASGEEIHNTSTACLIESLGNVGKLTAGSYVELVNKLLTEAHCGQYPSTYVSDTPAGRNYGLFPYAQRLDEIFTEYRRWDIKQTTKEAAEALIKTDPLILESIAAGHKWYAFEVESDSGYWYVPSTKPNRAADGEEATNAFIKPYEPVVKSKIGFTYENDYATIKSKYSVNRYIDNPTAKNTATNPDGLRITDVNFVSHDYMGGSNNVEISNAYIVDDDCEINLMAFGKDENPKPTLSGTNQITLFVDPTQKHNQSYPLVLILSCTSTNPYYTPPTTSISNTEVNIIINNNCYYETKNASNVVDYTSFTKMEEHPTRPKYSSRQDVIIFLKDGFGVTGNDFTLLTTGAYQQAKLDKELDVVSNPLYPGTDGWSATENRDNYKYQIVPNVVIFGQSGASYPCEKNPVINAEILMPDSNFITLATAAVKWVNIWYRENPGSLVYDATTAVKPGGSSKSLGDVNCIGSIIVNEYEAQNLPTVIYIGDAGRNGTPATVYTKKEDPKTSGGLSGGMLSSSDKDYFANDHMGAN